MSIVQGDIFYLRQLQTLEENTQEKISYLRFKLERVAQGSEQQKHYSQEVLKLSKILEHTPDIAKNASIDETIRKTARKACKHLNISDFLQQLEVIEKDTRKEYQNSKPVVEVMNRYYDDGSIRRTPAQQHCDAYVQELSDILERIPVLKESCY